MGDSRGRGRVPRFSGRASADERADSLREAIYVAFTLLAVLVVNLLHGAEHPAALAGALALTSGALALTMFAADAVSHIVAHDRGMTPAEWRHAARASFGPLVLAIVPILVVLLSEVGWWSTDVALTVAIVSVGIGLCVVGWIAIRGITATGLRRAVLAVGLGAVAAVVIAIQVLAHG